MVRYLPCNRWIHPFVSVWDVEGTVPCVGLQSTLGTSAVTSGVYVRHADASQQ